MFKRNLFSKGFRLESISRQNLVNSSNVTLFSKGFRHDSCPESCKISRFKRNPVFKGVKTNIID